MVRSFQKRLLLLVCVDSLLQEHLKVKVSNQLSDELTCVRHS